MLKTKSDLLTRIRRIYRRLKSGKKITAPMLAKELGCCKRSITRDLEFMRDRLEIEIEYDFALGTWKLSAPEKNQKPKLIL